MVRETGPEDTTAEATPAERGRVRADARRNLDELLKAAMKVFASKGVDAPVRDIAKEAGVGVGTLYRHFPQRSDLVLAVCTREIDACADAAATFGDELQPFEAVSAWMNRYVQFIMTKRGLAAALYSGDPAYQGLPAYFEKRLHPALQGLLDAAEAAGAIRSGLKANELLRAVASFCAPAQDVGPEYPARMLELFMDGLRYRAPA
ncbi:MAG TPA: helix-turn-helix domain-containing protein [Ensifer sp.]|jgi:AcrR family transcriptional regulator|uniref:TetR/AcrR family transcriptional regulator n=1 Tax=Ensifer sp. TaxID=1872086 RepID=UPI002E10078A|nr:helix-turn-helix domain-containing protein [Ensifer sp.]